MATLNPGNIVNGNTIQTSDLLQLYKAFGTGSGDSITGLAMTGSLHGTSSWATSSSIAASASKVTTITTGSGAVYYPVVVTSGGSTNIPIVVSTFELSASVLNNITASRAITASYALNGGSTATQVNGQRYIDSSFPATVNNGNFQFIAGGGTLNAGVITSSAYVNLANKTLGRDVWITATYIGDVGTVTTLDPTLIVNLSSSGAIIIEQKTPQDDTQIVWTGMFI